VPAVGPPKRRSLPACHTGDDQHDNSFHLNDLNAELDFDKELVGALVEFDGSGTDRGALAKT
jgi:hypothetical protein